MKYIDSNLEKIDKSSINFDIETHYKKMLSFIENLGINKNLVLQLYYDSLDFVLEFTDGTQYRTIYNEEIHTYKFPYYVGALTTLLKQKQTEKEFLVTPGICLRNQDIENNLHVFTHELFHAFSMNTVLPYNENGINYAKSGLNIMYCNKKDEVVNNKYNSTGLNEGITELLTRNILNEKGNNNYHFQVIIAQILTNNDSSLFESYFSRNDSDVINFFQKFEYNQDIISKDELINMSPNIITEPNTIHRFLEAAIDYNLKFVSENDLDLEISKIKDIVSELDLDLDYKLDSGSYIEIIDDITSKYKSSHK